ncbi:hypothetical protein Tsubulata_004810 [Turnera subulata]|uniref:DUF4228 domain-containing protein n=1 Tax=Turnera subulata TaxID=218843 RepID=A0A9Q0J2V1_9ROSI|nr:hypothetical protein Tsubulata_004810 [Turnera subulata]
MGLCASSQSKTGGKGRERGAADNIKQPSSTIKIIQVDGKLQVLKQPVQARNKTSQQDPNCFLCSLESMSIGNSVQRVPDEEELQPGQIYFLLPLSLASKPLSLPDLCGLAIKASSALGNVDFASNDSMLIFR